MRKGKIALWVLMLAGCLQAADVSCEWAVADKPRNLAEGAVADQFFQVEFWGKALKRVENQPAVVRDF